MHHSVLQTESLFERSIKAMGRVESRSSSTIIDFYDL
jgi:hypothetical protein